MIYLYGLVSPGLASVPEVGISGEPIARIPFDRFDAIVGQIEGVPDPERSLLEAHDGFVRAIAAPSVLPAGFGQTAPDEDALARVLARAERAIAAALDRVAGCVQMTLRVRAVAAPAPQAALQTGPGTAYLAARMRAARVPELDPLRARLAPFVREERVRRHGQEAPGLVSLYHLVPADRVAAYREALAGVEGLAPTSSGPWPPYAFAPEVLA